MTTIAVRDGVIACDSMEGIHTSGGGDRYYANTDKIYPIYSAEDDQLLYLIGISGDSDGAPILIEWYTDFYLTEYCDKNIIKRMYDFDTEAIVLHRDGSVETTSTYGVVHPCREPFYAIGSGTKCALAAMHCGLSAAEAVEVAKRVDPHTGGRVQVYSFDDEGVHHDTIPGRPTDEG